MTALAYPHRCGGRFVRYWAPSADSASDWSPRVRVHEDEQQITLELDVPGVAAADLALKLEKDELTVSGERKFGGDESWRFARSFRLRPYIAQDAIKAELKGGVLRVTLPKREDTKPRPITIEVA